MNVSLVTVFGLQCNKTLTVYLLTLSFLCLDFDYLEVGTVLLSLDLKLEVCWLIDDHFFP